MLNLKLLPVLLLPVLLAGLRGLAGSGRSDDLERSACLARSACLERSAGLRRSGGEIVIGNSAFRWVIGEDGRNSHFYDVASGTDYLDAAAASRCARVRWQGKDYPVTAVRREGALLTYRFGKSGVVAELVVHDDSGYLRLAVGKVSKAVEELVFLDVPLVLRGASDEAFAACVLALNLTTHVRQLPALQSHLWAACNGRFGLSGSAVAVVGAPPAEMLTLIRTVMSRAPGVPSSKAGGAWALDNTDGYGSYLMNFGSLTASTVDKWVAMCRDIGFHQIDNHGGGFFNFGELKIDPKRFPGGWADFRRINQQLHDSGIHSIFHTYAFFIDKTSSFVTPEASPDLGYFRGFTLAEPLAPGDSVITVKESTAGISTITGFFVRNSVSLRIGGEIIEFTGVTATPPYRFTGCRRGAFGTRVRPYAAGEKAYHLKEVYGRFIPDGDSKLFMEIARRTAEVINMADFDGLYLDAIDGGDVIGGGSNYWYYTSKFIFEIARHLQRPVGMEMASMAHTWWNYRMRWQAWDIPLRGYKRFVDIHVAALKSPNLFLADTIRFNEYEHGIWRGDTAAINRYAPLPNGSLQLPLNLGWWGNQIGESPQTETSFPDDVEYLCGKMIGNDAGVAMTGGFDPGTIASIPLFGRLDSIIRVYEGLRTAHYFGEEVKRQLRQPGREYHLFHGADGRWNFRPVSYDGHKTGNDSAWTVVNRFGEQPLRLRIEALMGAGGYEDMASVVLADPAVAGSFVQEEAAAGVSGGILAGGEFFAESKGLVPDRAAYFGMGHLFSPALNLGKDQALGVWVKGDGSGALLNFRLESPKNISHGARGDHFVRLDFRGWKYFSLVELESGAFSDYTWPMSSLYVYDSYRHSVDFKNINRLQIWFNGLPAGKRVSCEIRPVKAVPLVAAELRNPVVTVNGQRLELPVTMRPGMWLELGAGGDCKLYSAKGELVREVAVPGGVPVVRAGANEVGFGCEGNGARAKVTVITEGAALREPARAAAVGAPAGYRWWDPAGAKGAVIEGQGWPAERAHVYDRFPARAESQLRPVVWSKSKQTAGLLLRFRSDAGHIRVRYHVGGPVAFEHMPATGVSGVDLYAEDSRGRWSWPGLEYVYGDTIRYDFHTGAEGGVDRAGVGADAGVDQRPGAGAAREYSLYLPLYNSVDWLQIGVPEGAYFEVLTARQKGLVVVYGTSIAQGGCASRPGMAWTAILGRRLHSPVVNLGFSSNGLLEPAIVSLMAELDAKVYILDCLPNMTALPADTIRGRIFAAVRTLQQRRPGVPIVLAEHGDANIGLLDTALDGRFRRINVVAKQAFAELQAARVRGLYYLRAEEIGLDAESTVDGSHPSDLGMERYAEAYWKLLRGVF